MPLIALVFGLEYLAKDVYEHVWKLLAKAVSVNLDMQYAYLQSWLYVYSGIEPDFYFASSTYSPLILYAELCATQLDYRLRRRRKFRTGVYTLWSVSKMRNGFSLHAPPIGSVRLITHLDLWDKYLSISEHIQPLDEHTYPGIVGGLILPRLLPALML